MRKLLKKFLKREFELTSMLKSKCNIFLAKAEHNYHTIKRLIFRVFLSEKAIGWSQNLEQIQFAKSQFL